MVNRLKWLIVAGARPNFMKIAPLIKAIKRHNENQKIHKPGIIPLILHTGQHFRWGKYYFELRETVKKEL